MQEIWKDIKGYEGLYQVSNLGNVKSLEHLNSFCGRNQSKSYECNQLLKSKKLKFKYIKGYAHVTLYNKLHNHKIYRVHRLVAEMFIPNPNNYPIINHKNGIRDDNRVENLEWCDYSYNNKEAFRVGNGKKRFDGENPSSRSIAQYDLQGNFIKKWESIATACRTLKMARTSITECLSGKRKTAYKSLWKYADTDTK